MRFNSYRLGIGNQVQLLRHGVSIVLVAVFLASGCTSHSPVDRDRGASGHADREQTSSAALREVYVPGSYANVVYDSPSKKLDPLLNPRTSAPPFKERGELSTNCSSSTKIGLVDDQGLLLTDEQRFNQIMQTGGQVAYARHLWQFEKTRNEAQLKKVTGTRVDGRGEAAQPRPSGVQQRNTSVTQSKPLRQIIQDSLKPSSGGGRSGMATADEINGKLPNYSKMQEDLMYNAQVLQSQDDALKAREGEYVLALMHFYQDAFSRLQKFPVSAISLGLLNRFDKFRFTHVFACAQRGQSTEKADAVALAVKSQYEPMAKQILESNRGAILKAIKSARSTTELQSVYRDQLSTVFLKDLAAQDALLAQGLQQQSNALIAQETREREETRKRREAEQAQMEILAKKKYVQNAAQNVAPTKEEVGRLFSAYDAEINRQFRNFRIERTGQESFIYHAQIPFFGEVKAGKIETGVNNLVCKPEQNQQRCSFSESRTITDYHLGMYTETFASKSSGQVHESRFFWDASGLNSPALKEVLAKRMKEFIARQQAELEAQRQMEASSCRRQQSWYKIGNTTYIDEYCQ
ncbi:hypothetical protein [Dechloromonas sp. CZR5]|uniref:hypothetical protein n=1 Tax=Dechloromonas sp. CZR5 TaxID=2608630 RepID=UPI00123C8D05|nr:hypothetical protein [Dechloromonas sp. CZR5]